MPVESLSEDLSSPVAAASPQAAAENLHGVAKTPRSSSPSMPAMKIMFPWSHETLIVATVIAFAALLAWIHLRHASIWYDEAITLLTSSGHAHVDWSLGRTQFTPTLDLRGILVDLYRQDVHPPLYFWSLAIWRVVFGASIEVARSFSALFVVATLVLLHRIGREVGVSAAWIPVAVYAASSAGMWYAYDARPYSMATFFIVLTQFLGRRKSRWTGFCAAAGFATHYFALLCIAPLLGMKCVQRWKTDFRWVLFTLLSFGLCSLPLLGLLRAHFDARPHQYPGFGLFPEEVWALIKGSLQGVMPYTWLAGWGIVLLVGAVFAAAGLRFAIKESKWEVPVAYGIFLSSFLLLAVCTDKSIVKMPSAYYLGLAAPWLALLIGYGVELLPRLRWLLAGCIVMGVIASRPIVNSTDYREMVARMQAKCSHCPIVVGTGFVGAVPACVLYESRGMPVFLLNSDDSVREIAQKVGVRRTIFFVPTNEPPTVKVEKDFLRQYWSSRKTGYFEVSLVQPYPLQEVHWLR